MAGLLSRFSLDSGVGNVQSQGSLRARNERRVPSMSRVIHARVDRSHDDVADTQVFQTLAKSEPCLRPR